MEAVRWPFARQTDAAVAALAHQRLETSDPLEGLCFRAFVHAHRLLNEVICDFFKCLIPVLLKGGDDWKEGCHY